MRVSEYFNMGLNQSSIDFVDVYVDKDIKLFIDPRSFIILPSEWGNDCLAMINDYFSVLLSQVHSGNKSIGLQILSGLREPKETKLGWSSNSSNGRGVGVERSEDIWKALMDSEAVITGLVEDLEDTALMIRDL